MIVEFCRWGNSLAVRIPRAVADALNVSDGRRAEIKVENGALVLRPLLKQTRKPATRLMSYERNDQGERTARGRLGTAARQ